MVDVALKGLSNNPNDYLSDDGDLAFATNVSAGVDGLRTVGGSEVVVSGDRVNLSGCFYVHRAENATVYIRKETKTGTAIHDGVHLKYYDEKNNFAGSIEKSGRADGQLHFKEGIIDISSVGNTLVVSDYEGLHYFLLKSETRLYDTGDRSYNYYYQYLGNGLPNLDGIRFALLGHVCRGSVEGVEMGEAVEFTYDGDGAEFTEFPERVRQRITEPIMASVNKVLKKYGVDKNRFVFPFFIRCAFRLYDNSLAMHTVPIYIETASEDAVFLTVGGTVLTPGTHTSASFLDLVSVTFFSHELQYLLNNSFTGWEDIIKSVDIFASAPIYTHEQDGYIEGAYWCHFNRDGVSDTHIVSNLDRSAFGLRYKTGVKGNSAVGKFWDRSHGVCKVVGDLETEFPTKEIVVAEIDALKPYREYYRPQNPVLYYTTAWVGGNNIDTDYMKLRLRIGNRTRKEFERIRNSEGTFFLLKSIPLKYVKTGTSFRTLELEDKTLETLVNKEQMSGEFRSNDSWYSSRLISYNKRLHMGDISFVPWRGHSPATQCLYADVAFPPTWDWWYLQDKFSYPADAEDSDKWWHSYNYANQKNYTVRFEVVIEENCSYNVATSYSSTNIPQRIPFFFYPNPNAKKLRVTVSCIKKRGDIATTNYKIYNLEKHGTLYGAYCTDINIYGIVHDAASDGAFPVSSNTPINYGHYLAVSEVNNPFLFRAENIRTIGDGRLLALKSAATPISEGQYGQYPVYAFTSAGIYSLPIRDDGSVGQEQWLNTDIVTNTKAISYVDGGVVYPTDHGMKALRGGETTVMSEAVHAVANVGAYFPALPSEGKPYGGIPKFDVLLTQVVGDAAKSYQPHNIRNYLMDCSCCYDARNSRIIFYSASDWLYHLTLDMKSRQWGVCPKMLQTAFEMELPYGLDYDNNIIDYSKINESVDTKYKGLVVTRPIKLGSDDYKKVRSLKALGHFAKGGVQLVLWGSRDLHKWHLIGSSTTDTLRNLGGTSYKYFRVGMILELAPQEVVTSLRFTDEVGG